MKNKIELATFAAGCFWHVEEDFMHMKGVIKTTVGYSGGHMENPTYKDVCSDETGHAEAIEIEDNVNENDVHTIVYTSGTTGDPKGVMLSHKNLVSDVMSAKRAVTMYPDDKFFSFLPLVPI